MDGNTPVTLATAGDGDRARAVNDNQHVQGARHEDEYDRMALAVVTKDPEFEQLAIAGLPDLER